MKIEIEIPKEFECDYKSDKFKDFFSRVLCDIEKGKCLCGTYEIETIEMLEKAFDESKQAYDAEKIVEELEEFANLAEDRWVNGTSTHAYQEHKCWVKAIEIVRKGGVE